MTGKLDEDFLLRILILANTTFFSNQLSGLSRLILLQNDAFELRDCDFAGGPDIRLRIPTHQFGYDIVERLPVGIISDCGAGSNSKSLREEGGQIGHSLRKGRSCFRAMFRSRLSRMGIGIISHIGKKRGEGKAITSS